MINNSFFRKIFSISFLAFFVLLAGCNKSEFKQLKQKGLKAETPQEQIECFTAALNCWTEADGVKEKAAVCTKRANAYSEMGHYDVAIGDYNRAVELDPNNSEAMNKRANAMTAKDRAYDVQAQQ